MNPETKKPVDKKRVYDIFREECYDDGAEEPWSHRRRLSKTALPDKLMEKRLDWQRYMVGLGHTAEWYYKNVIWFDLCNSIIPKTEQKATEMALAHKPKSGWISPGCQEFSRNLQGNKIHLKQNSSGTYKVWWMPVLVRGKLHVECFGADYPGECAEGAQIAAEKLRPILSIRFPNETKPKVVMTDKGKGFYDGWTSQMNPEYKTGLRKAGLRALMGEDNKIQPGQLQDLMLHETAVSWLRQKLMTNGPAKPWEETREEYRARLQESCREINAEHDVEGLSREFPDRLQELREREGDRLKK